MIRQLILLAGIFSYGCDGTSSSNRTKTISASACAQEMSDGTVVDCELTASRQKQLKLQHEKLMRVDVEYPGPKPPDKLEVEERIHDVIEVTQSGTIRLSGGEILVLAGVKCDRSKLVDYLNAMFVVEMPAKVFFRPSGFEHDGRIYAYVWQVDTSFGDSNLTLGSSISPTNENLLWNDWCKPISQDGHTYLQRYKRISEMAS